MNIKVLRQYLIPQHALSRLGGKIADCKWSWWKNWVINDFIKRYGVDMSIAQYEKAEDYPDFNSFFTRYLKPGVRPIVADSAAIASPADGCISQMGRIEDTSLLQAKGFHFSLNTLLGGPDELTKMFRDGHFATIYLSPKDYHRVHMPLKGHLVKSIHIPGKLFSVNQMTAENVPSLFARNERVVCIFETAAGPMAVILVGAMIVASINTVWRAAFDALNITTTNAEEKIDLEKGAEMGHFRLGSTVIVLFGKNAIQWESGLQENSVVQMGQQLGKINKDF